MGRLKQNQTKYIKYTGQLYKKLVLVYHLRIFSAAKAAEGLACHLTLAVTSRPPWPSCPTGDTPRSSGPPPTTSQPGRMTRLPVLTSRGTSPRWSSRTWSAATRTHSALSRLAPTGVSRSRTNRVVGLLRGQRRTRRVSLGSYPTGRGALKSKTA